MSDGNNTKFIFCPRCGALMQPPYCEVCGLNMMEQNQPADINAKPQDMQGMDPNLQQGNPNMDPNANMPNPNPGMPQGAGFNPYANPYANLNQPVKKEVSPEEKRRRIIVPLAIGGTILVILLVLLGPILRLIKSSIALKQAQRRLGLNPPSVSASKPSEKESSSGSSVIADNRHFGRDDFDHENFDFSFYESMADLSFTTRSGAFDPYINPHVDSFRDQSKVFDTTHTNWFEKKDQLGPKYYEPFVDCVDEISYGDKYQIYRDYYHYDDKMGSTRVQADVAYVRLEGQGIPNIDELNKEIYMRSAADFYNYLNGSSEYSQYVYETITFSTDSYITYNDGKKMSIVLDAVVHTDDYDINLDSYIYGINIDLENGKILENDEIAKFDKDFGKEFRERCLTQNGRNYQMDPWTDEEIAGTLNDKESNIIFFTPLGLEIGMCYVTQDDILNRGWMTITLLDGEYEKYLIDPDLAGKGTAGWNYDDPAHQDLKGSWIHIDPALALSEERTIKQKFPKYDWEINIDGTTSASSPDTSEEASEEESEKTSEEASEEPASEDASETPDAQGITSGTMGKVLLKDQDDMERYFKAIMGEYYDGYVNPDSSYTRHLNPDQYFRCKKEDGKDVKP